jgi:hypothetical protein
MAAFHSIQSLYLLVYSLRTVENSLTLFTVYLHYCGFEDFRAQGIRPVSLLAGCDSDSDRLCDRTAPCLWSSLRSLSFLQHCNYVIFRLSQESGQPGQPVTDQRQRPLTGSGRGSLWKLSCDSQGPLYGTTTVHLPPQQQVPFF